MNKKRNRKNRLVALFLIISMLFAVMPAYAMPNNIGLIHDTVIEEVSENDIDETENEDIIKEEIDEVDDEDIIEEEIDEADDGDIIEEELDETNDEDIIKEDIEDIIEEDVTPDNMDGFMAADSEVLLEAFASLSGLGTRIAPYEIWTSDDFLLIGYSLNTDYILMNDIDLAGVDFTPFGNDTVPFSGVFDGNNYSIKNINLSSNANTQMGVFGAVSGTIKNLTIENITVQASSSAQAGGLTAHLLTSGSIVNCDIIGSSYINGGIAGGLVGYAQGTVDNSSSTASVYAGQYGGGLIGSGTNTISNSVATGDISGSGSYLGGLIGYYTGVKLSNSYATGNIENIQVSSGNIGGLIGYYATTAATTITDCYATGTVINGRYSGGLIGRYNGSYTTNIKNCYATGDVEGRSNYIGGLIGYLNRSNSVYIYVDTCYATGTVSSSADSAVYAGGLIGYNSNTNVNIYTIIRNSFSVSDLLIPNSINGIASGLVGYTNNTGVSLTNCYYAGTLNANTKHGIINLADVTRTATFFDAQLAKIVGDANGQLTARMKMAETFTDANWNFNTIWQINETLSYPYLIALSRPEVFPNPDGVKVEGVKIEPTGVHSLNTGESLSLNAVITPSDAANQEVEWFSSDESVAIVNQNGNVVTVGNGYASIIVVTQDGYRADAVILIVED